MGLFVVLPVLNFLTFVVRDDCSSKEVPVDWFIIKRKRRQSVRQQKLCSKGISVSLYTSRPKILDMIFILKMHLFGKNLYFLNTAWGIIENRHLFSILKDA